MICTQIEHFSLLAVDINPCVANVKYPQFSVSMLNYYTCLCGRQTYNLIRGDCDLNNKLL